MFIIIEMEEDLVLLCINFLIMKDLRRFRNLRSKNYTIELTLEDL